MSKGRKAAARQDAVVIYVSPQGKNSWSGRLSEPNRRGTDGPLASIQAAVNKARSSKAVGRETCAVRIVLREGTYFLKRPLKLGPRDSGETLLQVRSTGGNKLIAGQHAVTFAAFEGERPVVSGGRRLTGWKREEVDGREVWVAKLPQKNGRVPYFRQLFVSGARRARARLPRKGWFRLERPLGVKKSSRWVQGQNAFVAARGDVPEDLDCRNAEVLALQRWVESRTGVKSFDPRKRLLRLDRKTTFSLIDDDAWHPGEKGAPGALYCLENVRAGLLEPGQWWLDRSRGEVRYLSMKGERPDRCEIIVPWLEELVRLEGSAKQDRPVHDICFEGITFAHNEWHYPRAEAGNRQGAISVPGAVNLRAARNCAFERCSFEKLGTYALVMEDGCRDVLVRGNRMTDLGGGGVRIWHGCNRNTVSDNEISFGGRIFYSAIGVLVGKASGTQIVHNHIHDFNYTGIGVGWTWGYAEGEAYGNIIEHNHIHAIGSGLLSDLGGIYHLGVAPGTRIRYNLVHDIRRRIYGGGCVYLDEGSSNILVENNLLYDCDDGPFHLHYGRDNLIRNNIMALGRGPQAYLTRGESHSSFRFENNLVLSGNGELVECAKSKSNKRWNVDCDSNLYFSSSSRRAFKGASFAAWQRCGQDRGSLFADPCFVAPEKGDFRLKRGSPAKEIGFVEFDTSDVGPRPEFAGGKA